MIQYITKTLALALGLTLSISASAQKNFKGSIQVKMNIDRATQMVLEKGDDPTLYGGDAAGLRHKKGEVALRLSLDESNIVLDNIQTKGEAITTGGVSLKDTKATMDIKTGLAMGATAFGNGAMMQKMAYSINLVHALNSFYAAPELKPQIDKVFDGMANTGKVQDTVNDQIKLLGLKGLTGKNQTINGVECRAYKITGTYFDVELYYPMANGVHLGDYSTAFGTLGKMLRGITNGYLQTMAKTLLPALAKEMKTSAPLRITYNLHDKPGLDKALNKNQPSSPTMETEPEQEKLKMINMTIDLSYESKALDPNQLKFPGFTISNISNEMVDVYIATMAAQMNAPSYDGDVIEDK